MKAQVFTNEAGNEVIAMVIAFVAIQSQWITTHLRCSLQRFRLELLNQKVIGFTLIYQRRHKLRGVLHQQAGVIFSPDRKSTRLNSSHVRISYAVFCLKK